MDAPICLIHRYSSDDATAFLSLMKSGTLDVLLSQVDIYLIVNTKLYHIKFN